MGKNKVAGIIIIINSLVVSLVLILAIIGFIRQSAHYSNIVFSFGWLFGMIFLFRYGRKLYKGNPE